MEKIDTISIMKRRAQPIAIEHAIRQGRRDQDQTGTGRKCRAPSSDAIRIASNAEPFGNAPDRSSGINSPPFPPARSGRVAASRRRFVRFTGPIFSLFFGIHVWLGHRAQNWRWTTRAGQGAGISTPMIDDRAAVYADASTLLSITVHVWKSMAPVTPRLARDGTLGQAGSSTFGIGWPKLGREMPIGARPKTAGRAATS